MHETQTSLFKDAVRPLPTARYKEPRFELDADGRPEWHLTDEMGCAHVLADGAVIRDARFSGWNLAGVLVRGIEIDTVALHDCRIANSEIQHSRVYRLVVTACEGGIVFKTSTIDEAKFEKIVDSEAVIRLFDCDVANLLVTDCACGIDIAQSQADSLVLQNCVFSGRAATIRQSSLRGSRITSCTFKVTRLYRVSFFESDLANCKFIDCHVEDTDFSLSQIHDVTFEDSRIHKFRIDAAHVRLVKLYRTRALHVSSAFSDLFDIEVVQGIFEAHFDRTQVRSLMLWKATTHLVMKESRAFGLRLCDVIGIIGGDATIWWLPVIRRSILRGDGTKGIILEGADCTSTKVINDFGVWSDDTDVTNNLGHS